MRRLKKGITIWKKEIMASLLPHFSFGAFSFWKLLLWALSPSPGCYAQSQTSGWRHGVQCGSYWSYWKDPSGAEWGQKRHWSNTNTNLWLHTHICFKLKNTHTKKTPIILQHKLLNPPSIHVPLNHLCMQYVCIYICIFVFSPPGFQTCQC